MLEQWLNAADSRRSWKMTGVWGRLRLRSGMKALLAIAMWLFLTTFAPFHLYSQRPVPDDPRLFFQAVPLSEGGAGQRKAGELAYLGGWSISSNHPGFGGISAMHIEGQDVLALSDAGTVSRFQLPNAGNAALQVVRLADGPGATARTVNRDMEAIAVDGGTAWIGYESGDAVWRYSLRDWRSDAHAAPSAMKAWPRNQSVEAMLKLPGGRFLVFSEGHWLSDGSSEVLLFDGDPSLAGTKSVSLGYRPPDGYKLTDAALLPDGRVLYLNRRVGLTGFTAKLMLGTLPRLLPGTRLSGQLIADFRPPLIVDNMEAVSVTQENGRAIIWIASDNNFSPLQQTLLLKFALAG